jgi:acetylornithine deacetylase/succinyl-diaminopimelate desuccinylase-like protein
MGDGRNVPPASDSRRLNDSARTRTFVDNVWNESIVPALIEYITIPNLSPMFDPDWRARGHMERALKLATSWVERQAVPGLKMDVVRLGDRTPLVFIEVPGSGNAADDTVLYYGHLDKQPPMDPWADGLGPFKPVIRAGRLYGRGGADDGYAIFASVLSLAALKAQNVPHARAVVVIECCEESGSADLPAYIDALGARIGSPSLIVCLDSGCGSYDRLWSTTSLRGLVAGNLAIELLTEGIHSGDGSGLVASSFRVLRQLLERLEDSRTGSVLPRIFHTEIPPDRRKQAAATAAVLGEAIVEALPLQPGARTVTDDRTELLLNRTWRPALSITGAAGLPPLEQAGNVLRPLTAVKVSIRIPPKVDGESALGELKRILEADPPYGAKVTFTGDKYGAGWNAPPFAPWLERSIEQASVDCFGKPACHFGEGGTIPFMDMLGKRFPKAQFFITGVLGPHSNAHGPNEFLDIGYAKKLTAAVSAVVADHASATDK